MKSFAAILLGLFCTFGTTTTAQTIDVIVEQRVQLKPIDYTYLVSFESDYNAFDRAMEELELELEEGEEAPLDIPSLDDLEMTLEQQKFKCTRVERELSLLSGKVEALEIELKNEEELKRLEKLLETYDGVEGAVESAHFEDDSVHFETVYPLLLADARKKAEVMARSTGKTVGVLLSVQELGNGNDPWTDLLESYGKMFRKIGLNREMGMDATFSEALFKFSFRFELK